MPDDLEERYDAVAYPTHAQPATHPDRLATVATLMGMRPVAVDRCRVLELGCGDGGNLIPMALALPGSEFVGVDIAGQPVARGQEMISELGLGNVRLERADIRALGKDLGEFDYVIAHGVYSWVPPQVQDALLAACAERLTPNGVAFVSYNALPGGHIRQMVREMLLFHVREVEEPGERVAEAKALVDLLARAPGFPGTPDAYRTLMAEEAKRISGRTDADFFHDELAAINHPVAVTTFATHAMRHGLQLLGEANYFEMDTARFGEEVAATLAGLEQRSFVLKEQYADFLKCRQFRQSLLCRGGVTLDRSFDADRVAGLWASSDLAPEEEADGAVRFSSPGYGSFATADPIAVAALRALHAVHPAALRFNSVLDAVMPASEETSRFKVTRHLTSVLQQSYGMGMIELHTRPRHVVLRPAERPVSSPLARLTIERGGDTVVNLRHDHVSLVDDGTRLLLSLLDGTRDREALLQEMRERSTGLDEGSVPEAVEEGLQNLGRSGLLVE
jgi:methyltransferase-like protein/trans-aconitate methyltransferase